MNDPGTRAAIRRLVAAAPPLTADQAAELAHLLRPAGPPGRVGDRRPARRYPRPMEPDPRTDLAAPGDVDAATPEQVSEARATARRKLAEAHARMTPDKWAALRAKYGVQPAT